MSRYVEAGYWVRGYAEGDYVNAALSSNAASSTVAAAGFLASAAAASSGSSTTTFSPYRVQQAGLKADGSSNTDIAANVKMFVALVNQGQSQGLSAAALTINNTGAKSGVNGVMTLSGRLKWENEAEPGDIWTDKVEPSGIWTDRPEPGDIWSDS